MSYLQEAEQKATGLLTRIPWGKIIVGLLITVAVAVGLMWAKKLIWPVKPISSVPIVAQEAPQAVKVEKIYIPGPVRYQVYSKEELIRKIPVAPELALNPKIQFNATAEIPKMPYGGTAVGYTNMSTGKSGIGLTAKEQPWVEWGGPGGIGIRGGVGASEQGAGYTGGLYVRQKLITLFGRPVSATGEVNGYSYQKPDVKATVDADVITWR